MKFGPWTIPNSLRIEHRNFQNRDPGRANSSPDGTVSSSEMRVVWYGPEIDIGSALSPSFCLSLRGSQWLLIFTWFWEEETRDPSGLSMLWLAYQTQMALNRLSFSR
jgi:hypothetical protein